MALGLSAGACSIYTNSLLEPGEATGGSGGTGSAGSGGGAGTGPDASVGGSALTGGSGGESAGSSGSAGSAGSGGGNGGSGGTSGLETEILDDMEDGNGYLFQLGGRNGDWFAGNDGTVGGSQVPSGPFKMMSREMPDGGATCIDDCVAYTQGGGFTTWGSVMGANIRSAQMNDAGAYFIPPYDASAYCGVRFTAKIGQASTPQIRFVVTDKSSFHTGGVCNPELPLPNPQGCNDHHGSSLSLSTQWTTFEILFSELVQEGSGLQAAFDPANVYTFEFPIFKDTQFELWVDDLLLLKKPAGGACP